MASKASTSAHEQIQSRPGWPLLTSERVWSSASLLLVLASFSAATWAFPVGGVIALFLPAGLGTAALIAGTVVATVLVALAAAPVGVKYGIDTVASTKAQLGKYGSYITLALLYVSAVFWNSILLVLLGNSTAAILVSIGWIGEGNRDATRLAFTVAAVVLVLLALRRPTVYLERIGRVAAVLVIVLATWILIVLIREVGWGAITSADPVAAFDSQLYNYMVGFDIGLAPQLSFLPYIGALVRLVSGIRGGTWPVVFGLAIPLTYLAMIGLFAGLVVPESLGDPSVFIVEIAGTTTAVVLLIFTAIANIGTVAIGTFGAGVGLAQVPVVEKKLSWNVITAVVLLPVLIITTGFPDRFYENVGTFMAFLGVSFAPLVGIMIVDYYFLRNERLNVRAMFGRDPSDPYRFLWGINPAGVAGMAAGFATYIYLLHPFTFEARVPYKYISAGLPAALVAALVYVAVTRLVVIPRGWGGYEREQRVVVEATEAASQTSIRG